MVAAQFRYLWHRAACLLVFGCVKNIKLSEPNEGVEMLRGCGCISRTFRTTGKQTTERSLGWCASFQTTSVFSTIIAIAPNSYHAPVTPLLPARRYQELQFPSYLLCLFRHDKNQANHTY